MVIRAVRLTNFRRFRKVFVEFPDNLIGILGRNGTGKTTLVEAISWALYGHEALQGLGPGRQEKESLRRTGAGPNEDCAVELWFEVGGEQYRVLREIRGKAGALQVRLYREGSEEKPVAERDDGVRKCLERLIGLDARSFRASVLARQRELAAFSDLRPEERKQTVNRLVGIDLIDRARQQARELRNLQQKLAEGLEKGLEDIDQLRSRLREAEAKRDEAKAKADEAKQALEKIKEQEQEKKLAYDREQERRAQYLDLSGKVDAKKVALKNAQEQLIQLDQQIEEASKAKVQLECLGPELERLPSLRREKEAMDGFEAERRRLPDLRNGLEKCRTEQTERRKKLGEARARLEVLRTRCETLAGEVKRIPELEKRYHDLEQELKKIGEEIGGIKQQGEDLGRKRDQILQLGPESPCPVCRRPLGAHRERVLAEFEEELAKLRQQYKEACGRRKNLETEKQQAEETLRSLREREKEFSRLQAEWEATKRTAEEQEETLAKLHQEEKQLTEKIAHLEALPFDPERHRTLATELENLLELQRKAERYSAQAEGLPLLESQRSELRKRIHEIEGEMQELSARLEKVGYEPESFERAKREYEEARAERERVQEVWTHLHGEYRACLRTVDELRERLKDAERKREELAKARARIEDLRLLEDLFGQFRLELAGRLRPLLEHRTSELVRQTTNGRYTLVSLDRDYELQLYDLNVPYPINRFSGGEQDLVNLCFRVAISQVVAERSARNPVRFIVLDEVFGSQDEERRQQILQVLNGLSHHFRQIFVITHIEGVRDLLPFVIEVVETGPQESSVAVR
jgi:exonuclease SbcC